MSLRSLARSFYENAPIKLKSIIALLYASLPNRLHFGRGYDECISFLESSKTWKEPDIIAYQEQTIKKILERAVDFQIYRDRIRRELGQEGTIDKQDMRKLFASVSNEAKIKYAAEKITTGGSTGEPLTVYLDKKGLALQKAIRALQNHITTGKYNPRTTVLRGTRFVPLNPFANQNLTKSYDGSTLFINTFTLDEKFLVQYIEAWNAFQPELVFAFPSSLTWFCKMIEHSGKKLHQPRGIITSSENLSAEKRHIIENVLGVGISDFYGLSECECVAFQHKPGCEYMVNYQICKVELEKDGKAVGEGEVGEIILTHLMNYSQPIVRYETKDMAIGAPGGRAKNGSWLRLEKIIGRQEEYLVTKDGNPISISNFNMHAAYWKDVLAYQIIQIDNGEARLLLRIKDPPLSMSDLNSIEEELKEKYSGLILFATEQVNRLYRTRRGKSPIVVSQKLVGDYDFSLADADINTDFTSS